MSKNTGKSALALIAVFVCGGIFALAAYGVYTYVTHLDNSNMNSTYEEPVTKEQNAPAALEYLEEEVDGAVYTLPGLDTPQVIEGEEEITYRYSSDNSITLAPAANVELMKHGMSSTTEETIVVDGVEATKVTGRSAKDGSETTVIIIPVEDEILFIRGEETFLDTVETDIALD